MYNKLNSCFKKFLAVLVAIVLSFSGEVFTFADESLEDEFFEAESVSVETEAEIQENKTGDVEIQKATSGFCGANLTWNFSAGTLTITGSGDMYDYTKNSAPWYDLSDDIIQISLPEGLSEVGNFSFYNCKNLSTITIPSSVTSVGESAFARCKELQIVNFGNGIRTIENAAFMDCRKLKSINLPNTLISIGMKSFYRCESITSVTVPSSVTQMGVSVFAYCKSLVSANIKASIKALPEYTFYGCEMLSSVSLPDSTEDINTFSFYGCDNLNTVYYSGTNKTSDEMQDSIENNSSGFKNDITITDNAISGKTETSFEQEKGNGTITEGEISLVEGKESSVSTMVTTDYTITFLEENKDETISEVTAGATFVDVTVIVNGEQGWSEVIEETENIIKDYGNNADGSEKHIGISLYLGGNVTIDGGFIETIAGKNVTVTVMTSDGSIWKINGKNVDTAELSGEYNLAYVLEAVPPEVCADFGVSTAFVLKFLAPAQINAEVLIHIGTPFGRQNATLFQKNKELDRLQSVVVDNEGYAHFYLGSVSEKTEYYIAMNLPDAAGEALIPENMLAEYGNPEYIEPIKYEITGRTSSWGMNLGQVMGILGGVMAGVVILVGGIMFIWNRQRLKNGYVPKFDDEE